MKIAVITDAWTPQVNGVVTTLTNVVKELEEKGHNVEVFHPYRYTHRQLPLYPEISIAINPWQMKKDLESFKPESIHIATEGPLCLWAAIYCRRKKIPYSTSYHTKWPEFVQAFIPLMPKVLIYKLLKIIHGNSSSILVTNNEMKDELSKRGFKNLIVWTRGIDRDLFNPSKRVKKLTYGGKAFVNVGRVSPEKNLMAFLNLDLPGRKIVVGDGPDKLYLQSLFPEVDFVGMKHGEELAEYFASADVFVFPSKSDTFGLVMIEAMASGTPVAAYPVTGPNEVVENGVNGYLNENLEQACLDCLTINRTECKNSVDKWSWENAALIFENNLKLINV